MIPLKRINAILAVASTAATAFELMIKTFQWYEKLHGKKNKKEEKISRPLIKGHGK